jgi:ABC-type lipoprotein release transport system permease subunit
MNKFIVGLILGIAIAGGLAYYLNNAPSQFVNKVTNNEGNGIDSNSSSPII